VRCDAPYLKGFVPIKNIWNTPVRHTVFFHVVWVKARAKYLFVFPPSLRKGFFNQLFYKKTKLFHACLFCLQQLIEEKKKWETDQEKIKLSRSQEIEELKLNCEKRGMLIYQYCNLRSPQQQRFIILTLVPCIFYYFVQWTNKCTINWQIIVLLLHVSTLLCHP